MGPVSKGGEQAPRKLLHDLSSCSTQVRDVDLAEGSLSHLVSVEDEFSGLDGGGSILTSCSSTFQRQPLVLLQLKRVAPRRGRLTADGRTRVKQDGRHYDVWVEPAAQSFAPGSSATFLEPGGPGYMPWRNSLRAKRAAMRKTKRQVPPLQLVSAIPRSPAQCKTHRRARVPKLPGPSAKVEVSHVLEGSPVDGIASPGAPPDPRGASRGSSDSLGLPQQLERDAESEDTGTVLRGMATWPLARASTMPSPEASIPQGKYLRGLTLPISPSVSQRSSKALNFDDRSWLGAPGASSSISNFEKVRGKSPGFLNQRSQVREMTSTMVKTMTATFPRAVWTACGVLHPEEEMEAVKAAEAKVVEEQIEQIKGLVKPALHKDPGRRTSDAQRAANRRTSFGMVSIPQAAAAVPPADRLDEKVLAHLAKQTGWSVLDVEEVWDVFCSYAASGRIGVQAPEFLLLVQDLYDGVTDDEVMLLQQHITAVRKRNHARSRYMRRALTGIDNATEPRSDVRFSEFYVALVKWLDLQQSRVEARVEMMAKGNGRAKQRCSLARFADGSSILKGNRDVPPTEMPGGLMNLDDFRRLKKEVTESLTGPHNSPSGIGKKMMDKKQQDKRRLQYQDQDSVNSDSQISDEEEEEEPLENDEEADEDNAEVS
mmetsp:Transcript_30609/g.70626  ORF Transcript_30609/g.70626 Transcript_30609/m.70626 type:complete len:655 (+) Transcript_30609:44-2008(+)